MREEGLTGCDLVNWVVVHGTPHGVRSLLSNNWAPNPALLTIRHLRAAILPPPPLSLRLRTWTAAISQPELPEPQVHAPAPPPCNPPWHQPLAPHHSHPAPAPPNPRPAQSRPTAIPSHPVPRTTAAPAPCFTRPIRPAQRQASPHPPLPRPTVTMLDMLKPQGRQRGAAGAGCCVKYQMLSVMASGCSGSNCSSSLITPMQGRCIRLLRGRCGGV